MQVVIVIDAAQPMNGMEFVDHLEFKGNPLATPIGKMGLVVVPPMNTMPFNGQMNMNPMFLPQGVSAQQYGLPMHLYLTKTGDFSLDRIGDEVFTGTIGQHVEKIRSKLEVRNADIELRVINRRHFNPGAGAIFHGQYHARIDLQFEPVGSQAVVIRKTEDGKWVAKNYITGKNEHIRLKRYESGCYTVEEGAKDITIHIAIKEIVCHFNESGELESVKYKDPLFADSVNTISFSVTDPFLNLIEGYTPVTE